VTKIKEWIQSFHKDKVTESHALNFSSRGKSHVKPTIVTAHGEKKRPRLRQGRISPILSQWTRTWEFGLNACRETVKEIVRALKDTTFKGTEGSSHLTAECHEVSI